MARLKSGSKNAKMEENKKLYTNSHRCDNVMASFMLNLITKMLIFRLILNSNVTWVEHPVCNEEQNISKQVFPPCSELDFITLNKIPLHECD